MINHNTFFKKDKQVNFFSHNLFIVGILCDKFNLLY